MYKLVVCLRYVIKKRITWFSVGSVILGVMALVVVTSIMMGYTAFLRASTRGTLGDIVIVGPSARGFDHYGRLMEEIARVEHVTAVAPRVSKFAILHQRVADEMDFKAVEFIGVVPDLEQEINRFRGMVGARVGGGDDAEPLGATQDEPQQNPLRERDWRLVIEERENVHGSARDRDLCLLGGQMVLDSYRREKPPAQSFEDYVAERAGKKPLKLVTVSNETGKASVGRFIMANTYSSGDYDYDSRIVYVSLAAAQKLAGLGDAVTEINVKLDPQFVKKREGALWRLRQRLAGNRGTRPLDDVVDEIQDVVDRADYIELERLPYAVWWRQINHVLDRAIELETQTMILLLLLLLVVAGFATIAILTLLVMQKRKDVGVLMAMGAPRSGVRGIFLWFGTVIGVVGATLGMGAGLAFLWRLEDIRQGLSRILGFDPFPEALYRFSEIPRQFDPVRNVVIWSAAVGVCLLASLYPAFRASRLSPVEIIRDE